MYLAPLRLVYSSSWKSSTTEDREPLTDSLQDLYDKQQCLSQKYSQAAAWPSYGYDRWKILKSFEKFYGCQIDRIRDLSVCVGPQRSHIGIHLRLLTRDGDACTTFPWQKIVLVDNNRITDETQLKTGNGCAVSLDVSSSPCCSSHFSFDSAHSSQLKNAACCRSQ